MVIPIRSQQVNLTDLGNAILIALGLREPPKPPHVEFVPPRALSPELSDWLERATGTCYDSTLSSRDQDDELQLVRADGGLDQLFFVGNTFVLLNGEQRFSLVELSKELAEELRARNFNRWEPLTVEIAGEGTIPSVTRQEVEANYLTLAPRLRATTNTIAIASDFTPWRLAASGVSHFVAATCHQEFFREAARALTAGYLAAGFPVLEQWERLGPTVDPSIEDPKEELAEIVSQAYTQPKELRDAMWRNSRLQTKIGWLAEMSYLWKAQFRYLSGAEDVPRVVAPGCNQR